MHGNLGVGEPTTRKLKSCRAHQADELASLCGRQHLVADVLGRSPGNHPVGPYSRNAEPAAQFGYGREFSIVPAMGGKGDERADAVSDHMLERGDGFLEVPGPTNPIVSGLRALDAHLHKSRPKPPQTTSHGPIDERPIGENCETETTPV
jgi:hypothetical protein